MSSFFKNMMISGLKKAGKYMNETNELACNFSRLEDEQLIRIYKSSTGQRRMACAIVLQQRGYNINHTD